MFFPPLETSQTVPGCLSCLSASRLGAGSTLQGVRSPRSGIQTLASVRPIVSCHIAELAAIPRFPELGSAHDMICISLSCDAGVHPTKFAIGKVSAGETNIREAKAGRTGQTQLHMRSRSDIPFPEALPSLHPDMRRAIPTSASTDIRNVGP